MWGFLFIKEKSEAENSFGFFHILSVFHLLAQKHRIGREQLFLGNRGLFAGRFKKSHKSHYIPLGNNRAGSDNHGRTGVADYLYTGVTTLSKIIFCAPQ